MQATTSGPSPAFVAVASGIALVGLACLESKCGYSAPALYVARTSLARNHFLVASDLERPSSFATSLGFYLEPIAHFEGKYLAVRVDQGASIRPIDVQATPDLDHDPTLTAIAIPMKRLAPFCRFADANVEGTLVAYDQDSKKSLCEHVTIGALTCGPEDGTDTCAAIVLIQKSRAEAFRRAKDSIQWLAMNGPACPDERIARMRCDPRVADCLEEEQ
jgi:hypothetical protein